MSGKILIVDDDQMILKVTQSILERYGYLAIPVQNGAHAWEAAHEHQPDVILLDVSMPEISGYDIAKKLRQEPTTMHIPIIMQTALGSTKNRVIAYNIGIDQYLTKPVHHAELVAVIQNVMQRTSQQSKPTKGLVLGVIGVMGGVGTTTVAINLAATVLSQRKNPLLVDFHLMRGSIGHYLKLGQSGGLCRLLDFPAHELTEQVIDREVRTHETGIQAILSSNTPGENREQLTREKISAFKSALCKMADPVIIDIDPHHNLDLVNEVLDRVIIVLEPNRVALSMAHPLIDRIGVQGRARISLVIMNRSQSSLQRTRQEIADELDLPVTGIIAGAPELAFQAGEAGVPMVFLQPKSVVSQQFLELSRQLLQPTTELSDTRRFA